MEMRNPEEVKDDKNIFIIYLDLMKTSYRFFKESPKITAGELVERILSRYVEQGFVKEKRKEFSLYLINSRYIESHAKYYKNKGITIADDDNEFETTIDSATKFPDVMKRKLNHRDRPFEILQRTNKKMKQKDPQLFQWDIYFLSHTPISNGYKYKMSQAINKEADIYDQLVNKITDKKFFHRKGICQLKAEKDGDFMDVMLILTGDHLYYVHDTNYDNLNLILLTDAALSRGVEK